MTEDRKNTYVFVHIPRTGGTNFWYSTTKAYKGMNTVVNFLDLDHESRAGYGCPDRVPEVARKHLEALQQLPTHTLVHHHDSWGIFKALTGLNLKMFTLVRDPVKHCVSRMGSMRAHLVEGLAVRAGSRDKAMLYNHAPSIAEATQAHQHEVEDAVRKIGERKINYLGHILNSPEEQNYFTGYFANFFMGLRESKPMFDFFPLPKTVLYSQEGIRLLAGAVVQNFDHVGFTEKLDETYDYLQREIGVPISERDVAAQVKPRKKGIDWKNALDAERAILRYVFRYDYMLLATIKKLQAERLEAKRLSWGA